MKKILAVMAAAITLFLFTGCAPKTNKLSEEIMRNYAAEKGFTEVLFVTCANPPGMTEIYGTSGHNGAWIAIGEYEQHEACLVYPIDKYIKDGPKIVDFPFTFSFQTVLDELSKLKDEQGNLLWKGDSLIITTVTGHYYKGEYDVDVAFSFLNYLLFSVNGECVVYHNVGTFE